MRIRSLTEALDSPVEEASSSADVSAGTSIWRSRRSRTGPETRAAYLAKSVGVHLHPRSGCPSQPHPHSCVAFYQSEAQGAQTSRSAKGLPNFPLHAG